MNMTQIDTVTASTIECGDNIERWTEDDSEEGRYVIETVTSVEDAGDFIEVYTEESPEGFAIEPFLQVRIYGYEDSED